MLATSTTTTRSRACRSRKSVMSPASRSTASAAVAEPTTWPGRTSASTASRWARATSTRAGGTTPPAASSSARLGSEWELTSWPPKTRPARDGRPSGCRSGSSVTRAVVGARPCATAYAPTTAVVATEPRAPTNHTPVLAVTSGVWFMSSSSDGWAGAQRTSVGPTGVRQGVRTRSRTPRRRPRSARRRRAGERTPAPRGLRRDGPSRRPPTPRRSGRRSRSC